jgi:hypothetical protein
MKTTDSFSDFPAKSFNSLAYKRQFAFSRSLFALYASIFRSSCSEIRYQVS